MSAPRYAYLGPEGTFTDAAMRAMTAGADAEPMPVIDVPSALAAVRQGEADFAVVAIENTVEGGVTATLDTLAQGEPLIILQEVILPVAFELVAASPMPLDAITRVAAHSHGLAQCRRWLASHLPDVIQVSTTSNTAAAVALADGTADFDSALAPPGTAERLGLHLVTDGVADNSSAATRFVKVGRPQPAPPATGADKTTLVVHLPTDRSGALLEMLEQFAARGVNLSRIESRPRGDRPGEYSFSIDALAHIHEARLAEALVGLKRTCPHVVFLGSYPAAHGEVTPLASGTSNDDFWDAHAWVESLKRGEGQ
ncbi:prephenate dehydratase [Demequina sp. TTPB684]|uniref:prephenate dehydratase n=1 Tax=unclassified Demequina TaxID=2620311 RepID=UPI001CF56A66|nr:prephenate dehydratase [Demequina sp. TMPB413]MCB2413694.1 prephenate dehydratase [Demequina sp. TTPB684]UPU87756.1 prephenate dehydratase [Demequina sp. TMPB413]